MSRRVIPWLALCSLLAVLVIVAKEGPAQGPVAPDAPSQTPKDTSAAVAAPGVKVAASRVVAVTVYQNSALVTREVDVPAGPGTHELIVTPLPPTTINSSLYTEGMPGIRVLTTRFRSRAILEDTRADVRKLQDELKQLQLAKEKLEGDIKAVQANAKALDKLEGFTGVMTVQATEKGVLSSDHVIALSKHLRDSRMENARELVGLQQQVQANQEKADFASRQLKELASGTARTERDAVIVVERSNGIAGNGVAGNGPINGGSAKVRLNYLVDSASWRPQYKLHAGKSTKDPVQLEYLAALVQHTGEDWSNVKLVLSTAQPMLNAAPPELQVLQVTVVPEGKGAAPKLADTMALEEQVKNLRDKAQKDFNERKLSSGIGLFNTAAALDQSWELFNPEAAVKRGCLLAVREGPTVTYHLSTLFNVPSRNDEQVLEMAKLDMPPEYYYKAVPLLTAHVYRLADLTNKSGYVLLPGDATMYLGGDFVGQMSLPLVAIGEQFTVGFGVDPQLQVQRQMTDKARTMQGGNQSLRYEFRILVSSFKSEPVRLQVWDRLPFPANETAVGVSLTRSTPEISKDALYLREQRPNNMLRWDMTVDANRSGEKAMAINYEFKLELDKRMTISSFQSAGVSGVTQPAASPVNPALSAMPAMSSADQTRVNAAMAKLSPEDRRLAEAQVFCAIDQESLLGSTGPIFKEMVKGQPVFLCCKGCVAEARAHPDETIVMLQKLMVRIGAKK